MPLSSSLPWPLSGAFATPSAPAPVAWPGLAEMRGATHTRPSNLGRQIKLAWGLLRTWPHRAQFNQVLAGHPHWVPLFQRQARSFEPLVQSFLDRRLRTGQRFAHLQQDLATATRLFGADNCARLARGERVVLCQRPGLGPVCLGVNPVCRREGLWSLALGSVQADGPRLCQLSFSFLRRDRVMVGSVQGAAGQDALAMQGVRDATRAAEGLRPPHLLLAVLRSLCQRGGLSLLGVDPQHHVKKRWHQRELQVAFDYRAFWAEAGGERLANGQWALPAHTPERDLAQVPAKRRAMYRRRAELLAALPGQLLNLPGLPTHPA